MKQVKVENITRIKCSSNEEVAEAVMGLASPLLKAAGGDDTMKKMIVSLAVTGWNLSLFPEPDGDYTGKIKEKLPDTLASEKQAVFVSFVNQVIEKKNSLFGDVKKGITAYEVFFENGEVQIKVEALPVKPGKFKERTR